MPALASFIYVFLKALQQLNVIHHRVLWVIPISYGMALTEFMIVGFIAVATVSATTAADKAWLVFSIGTGASAGAIAAMLLHKRMRGGASAKRTKEQGHE